MRACTSAILHQLQKLGLRYNVGMLLGTTGWGWEQAVICIIMVLLLCIIIIRQLTYTILYSPTIRMVIQLEIQYEDVLLRKMKLINTMEVD